MPIDPVVHQQLVQAVEQCGVPADEAQITYEDLLQSEQILITSRALTDDQLACLATLRGRSPFPIIFYENPQVSRRSSELDKSEDRRTAREWLQQRGLLDKVPIYDEKTETLAAFARRLEAFCGIEPGTFLEVHPIGILTPKLTDNPPKIGDDTFLCLMSVISASNMEEKGIRFGFVGNEYRPEEERP